jgi:hypothetical protein
VQDGSGGDQEGEKAEVVNLRVHQIRKEGNRHEIRGLRCVVGSDVVQKVRADDAITFPDPRARCDVEIVPEPSG